ncbi:hypothetical protein H5410_056809 [Solanum commersonii]|uniref:Uncharacterized protein n=1 Tax=Solanum commersonii TaxID=4109 RepID=A0A9J5WL93_SOLCO|nr:hypothetical protein H5410_056809 [Solanum commersonii]
MADLVMLDMVDFYVILVDCRTRVVKFQFPNESVIEWRSSSVVPKGRFLLYFKARKLVSKGCVYHLVRVNDSSVETTPIQSETQQKSKHKMLHVIPREEICHRMNDMPTFKANNIKGKLRNWSYKIDLEVLENVIKFNRCEASFAKEKVAYATGPSQKQGQQYQKITVSEPRMFTKVNPNAEIPQFHNLGSQILKKTWNIKPTTLLDQISPSGTDEIDGIHFRHLKL